MVCPTSALASASATPNALTSAALNHILRVSRRMSHCHRVKTVPLRASKHRRAASVPEEAIAPRRPVSGRLIPAAECALFGQQPAIFSPVWRCIGIDVLPAAARRLGKRDGPAELVGAADSDRIVGGVKRSPFAKGASGLGQVSTATLRRSMPAVICTTGEDRNAIDADPHSVPPRRAAPSRG
ncbi:hypothetical protein GCM10022253_24980 [Sphingomonas endophytica]